MELAADSGRASHESLSAGATPVTASDIAILQQSGARFTLVESPFQASFRGLPIVGAPDVVVCEGDVALLINQLEVHPPNPARHGPSSSTLYLRLPPRGAWLGRLQPQTHLCPGAPLRPAKPCPGPPPV